MKGGVLFCVLFAIFLHETRNSRIGISASSRWVQECGAKVIETIYGKQPVNFVYSPNLNHLLPLHVTNPKILDDTKSDVLGFDWKIYNYVIQANNLSILEEIMEDLNKTEHKMFDARFLVITDQNNLSKAILKWFWENDGVYVAVLEIDIKSRTKSLLFTGDPNDALNYCGKQVNVMHNQSCIGSITDTIPKAIRNYNGCPATVGVAAKWRYEFDPRSYTLNVTQERLNISFDFVDINQLWPIPNIFGDMPLAFLLYILYRVSHVFARDNVVFVVPPADTISYIEVLFRTFRKEVWISILLGFVLFAATWYVICRFKVSFGTIIINTVRMTLCGSSNWIPNSSIARFLIMCYIIYSVHIQTAYVAELMRLLVSLPTGKHIESFTELMRTNLSISLDVESTMMIQMLSFVSDDVPMKELKRPMLGNCDPYNLTKSWYADKSFAFGMLLKTLQSVELRLQVPPPPYFVDTKLIPTVMNVFASHRCFYLIDSLDVIIDRLTESGLYDKLDRDRKFYAEMKKSKFMSEKEVVALSFEQLSGVFVLFICGLLLSTTAFFGELIVHRFTK